MSLFPWRDTKRNPVAVGTELPRQMRNYAHTHKEHTPHAHTASMQQLQKPSILHAHVPAEFQPQPHGAMTSGHLAAPSAPPLLLEAEDEDAEEGDEDGHLSAEGSRHTHTHNGTFLQAACVWLAPWDRAAHGKCRQVGAQDWQRLRMPRQAAMATRLR